MNHIRIDEDGRMLLWSTEDPYDLTIITGTKATTKPVRDMVSFDTWPAGWVEVGYVSDNKSTKEEK